MGPDGRPGSARTFVGSPLVIGRVWMVDARWAPRRSAGMVLGERTPGCPPSDQPTSSRRGRMPRELLAVCARHILLEHVRTMPGSCGPSRDPHRGRVTPGAEVHSAEPGTSTLVPSDPDGCESTSDDRGDSERREEDHPCGVREPFREARPPTHVGDDPLNSRPCQGGMTGSDGHSYTGREPGRRTGPGAVSWPVAAHSPHGCPAPFATRP